MIILGKLSQRTVDRFIRLNIIKSEYTEEYIYCFEYLFDLLLYTTSIVITGFLIHDVQRSLIYILCMVSLKSTAGGFHAKHQLTCSILSFIICLTTLITYNRIYNILHLQQEQFYLWINTLYFFTSGCIFLLSPVNGQNHKCSCAERKKLKTATAVLLSAITILYIRLQVKVQYHF